MKGLILVALAALSFPAFSAEELPTLEAMRVPSTEPSPGPDRVGDVVAFRVPGLKGEEFKFTVPEGDPLEHGWHFDENAKLDPNVPGYAIVLMKGGKLEIPAITVTGADGKPVAKTGPVTLDVVSAIQPTDPKPQEPADPRPPVSLPFPWLILVISALIALVLAGLVTYLLARYLGKGKKPVPLPPMPVAPPRPEDEVALEELAKLAKQDFPNQGKFKPHYFGISEILKTYIGGRYRFDAEESTSHELYQVLQREKGVGDSVLREVEEIFSKLDWVKFTDHVPPSEEGAVLLERAKKLVLTTRRPKIEAGPGGSGPTVGGSA